ncbi:MAG: histidine kinase [Reichenbachiella sp.]|uniref:histidine kinase n=1 Tax=Reichenbachiella sp. TaxID=2184521 RepID=UPI0032643159
MRISKNIALFLFLLLSTATVMGQEKSKKSKYESLSRRNISTDQSVPALLLEAEQLMYQDAAAALAKVEQALATSITLKSTFEEARCYLTLGKINESLNELELAYQNYFESYQRLKKNYRTTKEYRVALEGMGRSAFELQNFVDANRYYELLLTETSEEQKKLEIELKLAEIEVALGDSPKALERVSQLEPSTTYKESNSLQSRGRAIKARAFAQQEDFEAAENALVPSEIKSDQGDVSYDEDEVMEEIVVAEDFLQDEEAEELLNIYQQQDRKEEELALREKIAVNKADANLPLQATKQRQAIGKVLRSQGRTSDAIEQLEKAAVLAEKTSDFREQAKVYSSLAESYNHSGNSTKALNAYKKYSLAMEGLLQQEQEQRSLRETLLKKQQDIQELTKDLALDESSFKLEETTTALQAQQLNAQRILIYGLLIVLILVLFGSVLIYRNAKKIKKTGQLLALKSLRTQMNPHFIFNALNSVNQFIALNDERAANKFLAEFSKLMRMVLDNSQKDFISMREEQELLTLYLKLEHYRFRDQFDYDFEIDPSIDLDEVDIPPMLIQPYIENAIWHGLRYKEERGHLQVNMIRNEGGIQISVEDNGIGRKESGRLKTANQKKKNSVGLKNTLERVSIINAVYQTNFEIKITDLDGEHAGTRVEILTPLKHG